MKNEKQEKMLEKVRALLAKADSTDYPEEAQSFREKADALMNVYMIKTWMLEEGDRAGRPEPESRNIDTSFYHRSPRGHELWQLFYSVSRHCRCKVIWWRGSSTTPVIGLPADLDYFELLFTQLHVELAKRVEPQPDPNGSLQENGYRLRSSGVNWMRTTELMYGAGFLTLPRKAIEEGIDVPNLKFGDIPEKYRVAMKNGLAQKVREYRRREGLEDYTQIHPGVYQRSFAEGFVSEIAGRLWNMRDKAAKDSGDGDDNPFALAVRDINVVISDAAQAMYGEAPKSSGGIGRDLAHDSRAFGDGRREGRTVNISGNPQGGLRNAKQINS